MDFISFVHSVFRTTPYKTSLLPLILSLVSAFTIRPAARGATFEVFSDENLQEAIEKISSGDEILVGPGEYREHVYVESLQNVTIRSTDGPGSTTMLIQPDADYAFQARSCVNMTISGFTILGSEHGTTCADMTAAVFYVDSSGVVENCDIDLFTGPAQNTLCFRHGIVMQTWMAPGPIALEVRDCTIRGFQLNGILAYGNGRQMIAYRNRIEGIGPVTSPVQYGMLISNFASLIAEGNIIRDRSFITENATASGILALGANTTLSHASFNNFGHNEAAIISVNSQGTGYSTPLLSADDNYWGDPSGPGGNSPGIGDAEYGAMFSTVLDTVHAFDPITGQDWHLQTDEGRIIGARFLDQNHLYPNPDTPPFHRGLWLEYEVEQLPFLGNPTLTVTADSSIPSPATFHEYSVHDDSMVLPFWHTQPIGSGNGDPTIDIEYGTQGALGNEATSWLGVGAFEASVPHFSDAYFDANLNQFILSWEGEPGHSFQVERSHLVSGVFTPISVVPVETGSGLYGDPVVPGLSSHFYRIRDLGPTP